MSTSSPEAFLKGFFHALRGYDYCVLRNYEGLPESLEGSDLDVLIRKEDCATFVGLIMNLAEDFGGSIISRYSNRSCYLKVLGVCNGQGWGVAIDLLAGIDYEGVVYLTMDVVVPYVEKHRGIKVMGEVDSEMMALVKEVLNNRKVKSRYVEEAQKSAEQNGLETLRLFDLFGEDLKDEIICSLMEECGDEKWISLRAKMRHAVLAQSLRGRLKGRWVSIVSKVRRLFRRPGYCIAITGTDGAGKSCLIAGLKPVLEESIHSSIHYEHLRPNLLPPLGRLANKGDFEDKSGVPVTAPHSKPASSFVGSLIRLIYYMVDYTFGYWIKVYPRIAKNSKIVIFDRYYCDMMIDPRRLRIGLPSRVVRIFCSIVPKPDLFLCLGADAEVIYARKPETSLETVAAHLRELRNFCDHEDRASWVDTGCDPAVSIARALEVIRDRMSARYFYVQPVTGETMEK